ncbi:MAG TPA: enoyl-CoA hydratase/isomerase family protein [Chitinivibrionales bacterium]
MQGIESTVDSSVFIITLSNSKEGNRLNTHVLTQCSSALTLAGSREDIRAVLIRSNGPTFSQGMDFGALVSCGWEKKLIEESVELYADLLYSMYTLPKPVIAVVEGDIKAGGVGLASAADIILGSPDANFELAEVFFGLIPANVLPFIAGLRVSYQKARALILSAKKIDAMEALRIGLLDEVYPKLELEKNLKNLLKRLLAFSPRALAETKKFTGKLFPANLPALMTDAKAAFLSLVLDREVQTGIESFLQGGVLPWGVRFKPENPLLVKE